MMRAILPLLLALLIALPAWATEPITGGFGLTLGEKLPLSSKEVMAVGAGATEAYMLLRVPSPQMPFQRYFAEVAPDTGRVAVAMGVTRAHKDWTRAMDTFAMEMEKLEDEYGPGMRLGGGDVWKVVRDGKSATLAVDRAQLTVTLRFADERMLKALGALP